MASEVQRSRDVSSHFIQSQEETVQLTASSTVGSVDQLATHHTGTSRAGISSKSGQREGDESTEQNCKGKYGKLLETISNLPSVTVS